MVSIIITYYNGPQYIEETVKSCLKQTYRDIEIIIMNDCSPIPLPDFDSLHDEHVRIINNAHNVGVSKNNNIGAANANGNFLLFLGQDDILEDTHISNMLPLFQDSRVGFVYCDYSIIDQNGNIVKDNNQYNYKEEYSIFDFATANRIHSCGLMIRKKYFNAVGGYVVNPKYPNYGEWDLWIRMLEISKGFFCKNVKPYYRRHGANMTDDSNFYRNRKQLYFYNVDCRKQAYLKSNHSLKQAIEYYISLTKYRIWFLLKCIKCRTQKWKLR